MPARQHDAPVPGLQRRAARAECIAMIVAASAQAVAYAAERIRAGALVAFPTETVYGLGTDATDASAVSRIFQVKERPSFDPLIVHIAERDALDDLASEVPAPARKLIETFWPGALTLVLPKTKKVPDIVTAGLGSVAVRMPKHDVALQLIKAARVPIAAPSANRFGRVSPTTARHVADQLGDDLLIVDGGATPIGIESTVVSFLEERPELLRPGAVTLEEIESVIGAVSVPREGRETIAPGRSARHYAPRVPLRLIDSPSEVAAIERPRSSILVLDRSADVSGFASVEALSEKGDLGEAAANLFAALHRLDASGCEILYAVRVPERGLGRAIMDRLQRASAA